MLLFVILIELILLYRLSAVVHSYIYLLFNKVTKSKRISLWLYSLVFLPGTLVHEVAHFLMATVLFVKTGDLKLIPEFEGEGIKLGEIAIAKSDPVRRFFIGIAPVIIGLALMIALLYSVSHNVKLADWLMLALIGYTVFVIGNTMFASKKDMEESWKFFILAGLVIAVLALFEFPFLELVGRLNNAQAANLVSLVSRYLLIPIIVDVLIIFVVRGFRR